MASPFGGFVHTSPLSSTPHDPVISLGSNCIRDYFGPTAQTVADCLQTRGGSSSLAQIIMTIRGQCRREWNEERERLVVNGGYKMHRARGPASAGYVVDVESVRAALLILVQQNIVSVESSGPKRTVTYRYDVNRARLLPRYPRFVEYTKKVLDQTAASLVEELLIFGQMKTMDAVIATVHRLRDAGDENVKTAAVQPTLEQVVVESFRRLVQDGYIEKVLPTGVDPADTAEVEEAEFVDPDEARAPKRRRRKVEPDPVPSNSHPTPEDKNESDLDVLLMSMPYRDVLPRDCVWRVNTAIYHDHLRAYSLGRLVSERYGHKIQSAGSMVTSALKLIAHRKHTLTTGDMKTQTAFTPRELLAYLPKPIQQALEKKPGGAMANLSKSLQELSHVSYPSVMVDLEEVEGHPRGGTFSVCTARILEHLQDRLHRQVVYDRYGEVAARICTILAAKGHLESDTIAEMAMVPAKDTREILHSLYRDNYIGMFTLSQSKQHNPSNTIFLWNVTRHHMRQTVVGNVCTALVNLRLRRQHEVACGKDWIERAKETGDTDLDHHELDKLNYRKFCQGLERLDNATLQLDETLMVLLDF